MYCYMPKEELKLNKLKNKSVVYQWQAKQQNINKQLGSGGPSHLSPEAEVKEERQDWLLP